MGIGIMDTNWARFDPFLRKRGAQVEHHPTAFELRCSSSCLGLRGTWSFVQPTNLASRIPCEPADQLQGKWGSSFSVPDAQHRLPGEAESMVSLLCGMGGLMSPAWRGQLKGKGQRMSTKLKPVPTWAGERKSLSLIRNMFCFRSK